MAETATPTNDARTAAPAASRWLALVVLCAGMLMIVLDQTIVNVALPSIRGDLGFSQSGLAWVVNAYLIAFGALLLLAGRLGDLVGRKRVFLLGITVFVAASLLCGLAHSQAMLIAARFVQGVGGALTSAVILGMIVTMFSEPREQAKAMGIYSFVASGGASIGLLLGGVLTQALNWHWIFFVNLPIGIVAGLLAARLLTGEPGIGLHQGADLPGAALITGGLMLLVYTIVKTSDYGWGSARTLGFGAAAAVLLAGFFARQATTAKPLIPLRLFRSRTVSGANLAQALMVSGMFGMFFLGSLYMEQVLRYTPLQIGLAFLPVAVVIGALSIGLSARLIGRFGARALLLPAFTMTGAGLLLLIRLPVAASYATDLLPSMLLLGIGLGLAFPATVTLAMSGATPRDAGFASGLANTTLQVGGALGLAVLATLAASRSNHLLATDGPAAALTGAYHLVVAVGAVLVLAAVVVTVTLLRPEGRARLPRWRPRAQTGAAPVPCGELVPCD
jgi:EmrB/QacA subfamily drug resistance transporter